MTRMRQLGTGSWSNTWVLALPTDSWWNLVTRQLEQKSCRNQKLLRQIALEKSKRSLSSLCWTYLSRQTSPVKRRQRKGWCLRGRGPKLEAEFHQCLISQRIETGLVWLRFARKRVLRGCRQVSRLCCWSGQLSTLSQKCLRVDLPRSSRKMLLATQKSSRSSLLGSLAASGRNSVVECLTILYQLMILIFQSMIGILSLPILALSCSTLQLLKRLSLLWLAGL